MTKTYLTKIFTVLMLMMFSLGASADVKIFFGEKGEELKTGETTIKGDNGIIAIEQKTSSNGSQTTVYLTFSPDNGYTISSDNIEVYAVVSPGSGSTRTPEISGDPLKLNEESSKDPEKRYSVIIASKLGLWIKKAEFISGSKGNRGGITITTDTDNPVYYLIQSYQNTGFYMRPNNTNVTTLNSLTDEMKWFFLDAGTGTEGSDNVQYYYICRKNGENNQYMYFSGPNFISRNNRIWIALQAKTGSDDNYKFYIVANNTSGYGGYNIIPKGTNTSNKSSLNKQGGNAGTNGIQVGSGLNDEASCWNLIPLTDYEWSLRSDCFRVSDNTNRYFYKIKSQSQKNGSYYIKPGTTYVETSNADDDDMIWYFEEASSDALMTYYYIRHANTGKYLRYIESKVGNANATELADHTGSETSDVEARFQFIVVRGTNSDETVADNKGVIFNIIPRLFINTSANNIRSLSCDKGQGQSLATREHRSENTTHWSFVSTEYSTVCANPTITFSSATGKATIATATTRSTIYYTTDGTDPSSSNGTQYVDPFDVTAQTTIKAIVTRTGFTDSEVTTKTIYQVATPTIQNNGSNAISITCATVGAAIYYTLDGSTPTTSSTPYTEPLTENVSGVTIKAIAVKDGLVNSVVGSGIVTLQCSKPVLTKSGNSVTISCAFPSNVSIYYTMDGSEPSSSSTLYTGPINVVQHDIIKAIAVASGYDDSPVATKTIHDDLSPTEGKYLISSQTDFETFVDMANEELGASYHYVLKTNVNAGSEISQPFTGIFEADADAKGNFYKISGLDHALFNSINGGTVKNVILDNVNISGGTNVGAICNDASGATRIYNCGVLSTGTTSSIVSGSGHVGSIVGSISGNTRVINCYSYANVKGGSYTAGIVGYNSVATTQENVSTAGMVMNCMFYGDITRGSNISPVYGGELIDNAGETGINNYNYYRRNSYDRVTDTYVDDVTFDNNMALDSYHRSWPADAKYLIRFEYYRSILNSNRKLCTWWVNGTEGVAPTDDDVTNVGIAKWVLDPSIAPYPILKKWGKYSSVINQDPAKRINPSTKAWVNRGDATTHWGKDMVPDVEGQKLGTISVTIYNGRTPSSSKTPEDGFIITAMDTLYHDYCYGKIQLPYYNDIFGNPDGNSWEAKYGGNYTDKVVTGWDVSGGSTATDFNFADRNSYSGRVFAQGGYFYVPKGVTSITITAHWADAVYLCNKDYSLDRVNVASGGKKGSQTGVAEYGSSFTPAGSISSTFHGQAVYTTIQDAIGQLGTSGDGKDVYNQAIVLIGNVQVRNHSSVYGATGTSTRPFTIMSADLDFDNEPDNCLELQFRNDIDRPGVQPIRFDFLPIPELGLAIRTNKLAYSIGLMIPLGHFEITETAFMHTTQFEYDANYTRNGKSPVIINGGEHEMFTVRKHASDRTSYFLLGGNAWIHRFAPGAHPNTGDSPAIYLCPINVIGGEVKELYLSGLYRPELSAPANQGDPSCYIDGGNFDIIAGAGYEQVAGNVTFKINHSLIEEFYGGGINGTNPIGGNIDVTIDNSWVTKKYCGGPKVGNMTGKTVTTHATGTTFEVFYGGGNGGNSYYRQLQRDGDMSSTHIGTWNDKEGYNWNGFSPVATQYDDGSEAGQTGKDKKNDNKGYHAEYEFEVFNQSNGLEDQITQRGFIKWIQFGVTITGNVENTLTNCIVENSFYGGGNLATVDGTVTSTLTNTTVNGSVFGAGYSAAIPTFKVHNKSSVNFPSMDAAGTITDGTIGYDTNEYEWTNDLDGVSGHDAAYMKTHPTYQKGGKWYCYTWNLLENLGKVMGNAILNIAGTTTVVGNVYGGGEESDVAGNTQVTMSNGTIGNGSLGNVEHGNVYGGGKGSDEDFECLKAMVGVNNAGQCEEPDAAANKDKGTKVIITDGTVNGNVYGGGELGRVEWNTQVTIGTENDNNSNSRPVISGSVFGAGAGVETHGYSALVRGNSTVTVQGKAKVLHNVYGGGEKATVGRYWVKDIPATACTELGETKPEAPDDLPTGMPYQQRRGGVCNVVIQDNAQIGPDDGASDLAGHVFGAGKGVNPHFVESGEGQSQKMVKGDANNPDRLVGFTADNGKTAEQLYLEFLQTLALATNSYVTIDGSAKVKGSVMGGSENGFVQNDSHVTIQGSNCEIGTSTYGNVYGGGRGLLTFAEAGKVKGNTTVTVSAGAIKGNVYGGGSLGDVGIIDKTEKKDGQLTYNYKWKQTDGSTANVAEHNTHNTATNTGICTVTISGGTIGTSGTVSTDHGNVFGAGKGSETTWWCEKAIAYATSVTVSGGTVNGTVYGGGQVGRVEDDAKVVIGVANATGDTAPTITGSVFGAGAGVYTHGYSALVRGNSDVTVQGTAQIGGSVYGGGEIASVGRFTVVGGLPKHPDSGGACTVTIQDNAKIGTSGTTHNVYGACKGVDPSTITDRKSMQTYANRPKNANGTYKNEHDGWEFYEPNNDFVWVYYSEADYPAFLKTLALTSHPHVTIAEEATVYGSVYGGGQRGITLGRVDVDITGGTVEQDVYGGGALADTNCGNWDADSYTEVTGLVEGASVAGLYTRTGSGTTESPYVYTATTGENPTYDGSTTYYSKGKWHNLDQKTALYTTTVDLTGGLIKGDAYGGGLGQKTGFNSATSNIAAVVWGDIAVTLNGTKFNITKYTDEGYTNVVKSGRVFGCNNLLGSPQGDVTVTVQKTVAGNTNRSTTADKNNANATYELAAVYGGGNLADYTTTGKKTHVIINGCSDTSIQYVYGGGNAAAVPETDVDINAAYELGSVFGGGNGKDKYKNDDGWQTNPGANVNGNANTMLTGGVIHEAFGGSNEKGTISGSVSIDTQSGGGSCPLSVGKIYGAGKNADIEGDLIVILGCMPGDENKTDEVYGGAENANVKGDVELTITSGSFGKVFGGNNTSGAIFGHIKLNIEETGCTPIKIDELYLGGNMAAYSVYGYYHAKDENNQPLYVDDENTKPLYRPRTSANDQNTIVTFDGKPHTIPDTNTHQYADPELNVISATYIGKVFGGGLGSGAAIYGNPIVNINMIKGTATGSLTTIGTIGDVYGGGNAANVYGNTTLNIGTETTVTLTSVEDNQATTDVNEHVPAVLGANITGNVYGGGKLADVTGNTYVNICAKNGAAVAEGTAKVTIGTNGVTDADHGNVFGGGKGQAAMSGDDAFECTKAMVGINNDGDPGDSNTIPDGGTTVIIGNGTINGTVYGGGEIGRVERNTIVSIGLGAGNDQTSKPLIKGSVFGAGKGVETHGYSALVRGKTTVTIKGDAKVEGTVYGGGDIASVGRYNVKGAPNVTETAPEWVPAGMPYSLKHPLTESGNCYVTIGGYAEIGRDNMQMPTFSGHVFGAGKGILPKEYPYEKNDATHTYTGDTKPQRIKNDNSTETFDTEPAYITFIETLGMTGRTFVTIEDHAFVKGSVYGGSENGHVLNDTKVTIDGYCQIGNGDGVNARYTDWTASSLAECAHWDYGHKIGTDSEGNDIKEYLPYDVYDLVNNVPKAASDGHTFYGNVFGGGSGYFPYRRNPAWSPNEAKTAEVGQPVDANGYSDGIWLRSAGAVYGNTYVDIKGGHILTSVYGGNECTDVGKYPTGSTIPDTGTGRCTVNMVGGTVGVPRTLSQIQAHPVTCYVFGAGKGDQRINFNTWTNVASTQVNISGDARIYGSTFGGGEDGHIIGDAETNIGGTVTIGSREFTNTGVIIGTTGTSYVDGNVFGGGRGFSGDAQTAGTVGGNVRINISNGTMLGSVYGGGRLASVGTMFEYPTLSNGNPNPAYGYFKEDDANGTYGHVTIDITGGTIGNEYSTGDGAKYSGNVFGGSMGRLDLLKGTRNPIWPKMAQVKTATVNISGNNTVIRRSVYGGGELGTVRDDAAVTISGGTIRRDVYGGGYGSDDRQYTVFTVPELENDNQYHNHTYAFTPMQFAGCVGKSTTVNVSGGYIRKSVYGGGELASVGVINFRAEEVNSQPGDDKLVVEHQENTSKWTIYSNVVKHEDQTKEFALSWPYEFEYVDGYPGATHVNITGGRLGVKDGETEDDFDDNGDVYGAGKGMAGDYKDYVFCANVGSTDVKIDHSSSNALTAYSGTDDLIAGAVYGGGEDGHVMGDTKVTMNSGFVYHSIYGGGSGKGKFTKTLDKTTNVTQVVTNNSLNPAATPPTQTNTTYEANCYSITAGKVFGNTEVVMTGGTVVRNVYGGGNMGSVGKGNYAGGPDDYSTAGYGEKLPSGTNLWDGNNKFSQAFLNSGKCTVKISGGTIGYIDTTNPLNSMYPYNSSASLPYGNVFGGCRGESAPNITDSPRYLYSPEFFVGYANETEVTIEGSSTKILGSVYGGGMDGHIRRDASVTIKGGEIGIPYTDEYKTKVKTSDPDNIQWLARGNVYGAGSGIGKYKYDFNYDGDYLDEVKYQMSADRIVNTKEEDFSTSAGSVTRFTKVDIQGGTIRRNVYGGGSLSSIGAPKIGQGYLEYRKGDTAADHGVGKQTLNEVVISGGQIGDDNSYADGVHVYGGHVFGGSRGDASLNTSSFSTSMFTSITINDTNNPTIYGSVFGGGEVGIVKGSVDVTMNGGTVNDDLYGGGALANTNTGNPINENGNLTSEPVYNTTVNLMGGLIKGDAYGGGLGQLAKAAVEADPENNIEAQPAVAAIAAMVYGNVDVTLGNATENVDNATATSFMTSYYTGDYAGVVKSGRVFGCNNLNGSPKGNVTVTVNRTVDGQDAEGNTITKSTITRDSQNKVQSVGAPLTYQLPAVYGGGNLADYTATGKKTNVRIMSCDVSIKEVYGGGNAAKVPETDVLVNGAHEIESLFGGGNGADKYTLDGGTTWNDNPGADIDGNANTLIKGGYVHEAYGGSNEKGTITGSITIDTGSGGCAGCPVKVDKLVGAGKNADVNGDLIMIMGCKDATFIPVVYGGADNANVKGNVELTITSGHFGKVFGGNNAGGSIFGHITLNIEETSECEPIRIDELYLGGNDAAYSRYGYYQEGTTANGKPIYKPRTAAMHAIAEGQEGYVAPVNNPSNDDGKHPFPYDQPVLNVISCTSIDEVFGGGYGVGGAMYADPTVNINMIKGSHFSNISATTDNPNQLGEIGTVYGGGNAADVIGNPTVNIGTATSVTVKSMNYNSTTQTYTAGTANVLGAYITGDVFGGGKGSAENYECDKAMVGKNNEGAGEVPGSNDNKDKGTKVNIANGTVKGNVYGGGQLGRVEWNTQVTIGTAGDTNDSPRPVISGSVYGAGAGVETHGYSALVRGNSTVTVQGKAKVLQNVYGGGEKATVGRYWVKGINNMDAEGNVIDAAKPVPGDLPVGMPYKQQSGGICTVLIQDNAQIGPDDGGTSTAGHVFGAGKGVVPQFNAETSKKMVKGDADNPDRLVGFAAGNGKTAEQLYLEFLQTLALATNTNVTIDGSATVKGSVYGGSESGYVQHDTKVEVKGGTIGTPDHGGVDFGNVFGGGKGDAEHTGSQNNYIAGGIVKGSTKVEIENGTILHNIYGGGAYGSVGVFDYDTNTGLPIALNAEAPNNSGKTEILITGGTIGTNGHENGMVFGSSRGDVGAPGAVHDKLAWVYDALVTIGTLGQGTDAPQPQIKGSLYGSGENGHTFHDAVVTIHSGTIGITDKNIDGGARYAYRGNVYGGGCGTDTYTGTNGKYYNPLSGIVYGNATVNMDGGHVVRNIYGGGAMGSVGNFTFDTNTSNDILDGKPISCATGGGTCYINISGGMVGNPGAQMIATGGPDAFGLVFGAGRGDALNPEEYPNVEVSGYVNNTEVTISGTALVTGSVFGGSQSGHVLNDTKVTIAGGQIGCGEGMSAAYSDDDFTNAFDPTSDDVTTPLAPCAHWEYKENGLTYDKFYGAEGYNTEGGHTVATDGHTFYGNVFGGGSGYTPYAAGKWLRTAGVVEGNSSVIITDGHILTGVYGGNEHTDVLGSSSVTMSGGTVGVPMSKAGKQAYPITGNLYGAGKGDKRILFNTWTNVRSTFVTVSGGTVYGEVFGGGEDGHVLGDAETTISENAIVGTKGISGYDGNVFGGGRGSVTALTAGVVGGNATLNILGGQVLGSAYGGGRLASVGTYFANANESNYGKMQSGDHGQLTVNIRGGAISHDVFGGCMGTTDGDLHDKLGVAKSTVVNLMGGTVNQSIYGGGEVGDVGELADGESSSHAFAKVNLLGGSVVNVYGGGLGKKTPEINAKALVKGNATVNLNGLEKADYDSSIHTTVEPVEEDGADGVDFYRLPIVNRNSGCKVTGNIFGCNNVYGTPEGHAKVHVFMTTPRTGQADSDYDVSAIYGGGNQADYEPTDDEQSTEVIIEGCDLTKIQQVYGGGNAAASPGTKVTIKGTKLIDEVFGGGNGVSTDDFTNPGANVGYHTKTSPTADLTPYATGDGKSVVELIAGTIRNVYGGSNSNGNIRGGSSITQLSPPAGSGSNYACCSELKVNQMYGGGKNAEMNSGVNIVLGCTNSTAWIEEIYPGAEAANIGGDVSLTITSGKFGRVFGGNNKSGTLNGSITINIEENGACGVPVIIGEIYGGGNKAPYSVYGYDSNGTMLTSGTRVHADPQINVRAFTSIGTIYGGGYGESAVMYGSPTVNVNVVNNNRTSGSQISDPISQTFYTGTENEFTVTTPTHDDGKIGAINNVFGGGNAAKVDGNTTVNVGTTEYEYLLVTDDLVVGTTDVSAYYTRTGAGTTASPFVYTKATGTAVADTTYYKRFNVVGADIRGNVYGGGNKAEVTGNTHVVIGQE